MTATTLAQTDKPTPQMLSIVIPVYNELNTWKDLFARVAAVQLPGLAKQIILVEDGSKDGTREQLSQFAAAEAAMGDDSQARRGYLTKVIFHEVNQGKGAALRTGFASADGQFVIIQDADLEYDPNDYPMLVEPLLRGEADVVYGSRFAGGTRKGCFANFMANRFLTGLSNITTGLKLTDMETCYKVFRTDVLRRLSLEQNRFGFEPEITAKIAALGVRVVERPIKYFARTHNEGKKIGWKDGVKAVWCILKYGRRG